MTAFNPRGFPARFALLLLGFLLVVAWPAEAHHLPPELEEIDEFADEAFKAGLRHPGQGIDHWLLAAVAGVLAAGAAGWRGMGLTAAVLLGGLMAGAGLQAAAFTLPGAVQGDWIVSIIAGALLFAGGRLPLVWRLVLLALAAFWQGQGHAAAWPWESVLRPYMTGVLLASGGLFLGTAAVARLAGLQRAGRRAPAAA